MTKILVIDDKHDNLVVVEALLKNMLPESRVYTALSGVAGLKLARDEEPDTILLDIKMPGMDGYEVCSELKANERTKNIPIIMLTAIMTDSKSRIKGLELGADAFLNKPINAEELVAQIKVMLRIKSAEDTLRQERDSLEAKVKERTKTLEEKDTLVKAVLDNLPIGVAVNSVDPAVTFSYMNDNFIKYYRTTREKLTDPDVFWDVVYQDASFREEMKKRVLDDCATGDLERMIWADIPVAREGEETAFITARNIPIQGNKLMISTVWDVTERKRSEAILKASELRYDLAMNASQDGIYDWNLITNEIYYSPGWKSMLGYADDELPNDFSVWETLTSTEHVKKSWAMQTELINKQIDRFEIEFKMKHKDGHWLDILSRAEAVFDSSGQAIRIVGTHVDITDRKRAEQARRELEFQLHQSQKLEAVGTMVSGISHEFNNVLQSIFLYAGLVENTLPDIGSLKSNFQHIMDDAVRARDLVAQILTFSRKTKVEMNPHPIGELVTEALLMERASMSPNIEIQNEIDLNCGMVVCDKTQIFQIVINLCNNAQYAMRHDGGMLSVRLRQKSISMGNGNQDQEVVELVVRDTGQGMDHETVEKVFDPFFTTKEIGKGTGLGLSVVHGIVEMMDGQVSVTSELGKGTKFTIVLPLAEGIEDANQNLSEPRSDMKMGNVLLVDDEESIRSATESVLQSEGFKVETAMNGKQALDLFNESPGKFDLIITDLSMPEMSGLELSEGIRKLNTKVPIILSTGQLEIEKGFNMEGITSRIQKPWSAAELIDHIRLIQE